ncbi:MAG: hypothetical protein ACYCVE_10995 [Gemmatimonadaceae bacterium]
MATVITAAVIGCGDNSSTFTPVAPVDASHMFWRLELGHHAITLSTSAPYDTYRLNAVALDGEGNATRPAGTLTFTTSDTHGVQVDSTGLLHALRAENDVRIIATLEDGDLIHSDTAMVNVLNAANPQPLAHLTLNGGGDTVQIAGGRYKSSATLPLTATDVAGNPLSGIAINAVSLDTNVVSVCAVTSSSVRVCAQSHPGFARVVTSTTTYGASASDTVMIAVSAPLINNVVVLLQTTKVGTPPGPQFGYGTITIAPGGAVLWLNSPIFVGGYGLPIDIVFDDSSSATASSLTCHSYLSLFPADGGTGNIAAFGDTNRIFSKINFANICRARTFLKPGEYHYHSTLSPATGTVVVTDSGYVGG